MLVDQFGNEPGQVLRRQAVIQRRRHRQSMIGPNDGTSCSAGNFGLAELGVCALSKTYLEQLAIGELISRTSFRAPTLNPITPPGVLPHVPCDEDCNRAAARLQRRGPILSVVTTDGRKTMTRGLNVESATRSSSGCGDMRPMRSPDGWASWVPPRPPMR